MKALARSSARAHSTCKVKQTNRLLTIQPRVASIVRFAENGDLQSIVEAAVQQRFQLHFNAQLRQEDAWYKAELQRKLRPFQLEFILNTGNELGKYAQPERLAKLALKLNMSPDGVQQMFAGIAATRNTSTHAGSLQALRQRVTDAQKMIDELAATDPTLFVTDVNLSFARDVLALYDTIERDFLLSA
ncbi:hypothetical protein CHLRE_12g490450v5 [Chlamydomonas reinhardtii]|uniref:Uncharacterized protein n=1 Tax=Chlamydomonas reinhardtii TaxID=3055 RepID=A8ILN9_CHLRE|nr:uncharacterized protein CHLRE_12g490450v5 [Chlamydomonas reinhardtii]PNW74610.1 hypothetical protein CHLRE_12g490450v5 [Chlamydomonas reinhardtii]|eukprot:XP_001690938.1 predicted protein [Chlamydomonas reinhardtii]